MFWGTGNPQNDIVGNGKPLEIAPNELLTSKTYGMTPNLLVLEEAVRSYGCLSIRVGANKGGGVGVPVDMV